MISSMSLLNFMYLAFLLFFFFKQKTAYEMRISDWSSDVCSSDLAGDHGEDQHLDARGYDMPEHTLGHERGPPEKGEGDKDEAREGDKLELENRHEDLHRENEEGEHDDDPGDEQDRKSTRLNSSH